MDLRSLVLQTGDLLSGFLDSLTLAKVSSTSRFFQVCPLRLVSRLQLRLHILQLRAASLLTEHIQRLLDETCDTEEISVQVEIELQNQLASLRLAVDRLLALATSCVQVRS
jgi:hypothetical protein